MAQRLENYLRTFRKRTGLSQREVALLLGCSNGAKVSRYERFARRPTLATALVCEKLFGVPVAEIFAGIEDEASEALRQRVCLLAEQLEKQPSNAVARKRQFLDALRSRNAPHATK